MVDIMVSIIKDILILGLLIVSGVAVIYYIKSR